MQTARWNQRLLASTRGRIITLLRRLSRTVNELAEELDLTDNGVRVHLASLERDGLIEQQAVARGGVGKPAFVYGLTQEAESLFPKAYAPILRQLLDVLAERMTPEEIESLVRETGRRAVVGRAVADRDMRGRLDAAVAVLAELGGMAELEEVENCWIIRGYSCPLAAVVPGHPEVCQLAEALLTELVGARVNERCERGERPRCCFQVSGSISRHDAELQPSVS
jgi:predicted ArsR family transcriptional regulator